MRRAIVNVYKATELTGDALTRVLEYGRPKVDRYRDVDDYTQKLQAHAAEKYGVKTEECRWSLSHSQGDGVAFYGKLDLEFLAKHNQDIRRIINSRRDVKFDVVLTKTHSCYNHWNTMGVNVEHDDTNSESDDLADELHDAIKDVLYEASRDTERLGYIWIDNEMGDPSVCQFLDNEGFEFDKDGRVFAHPEA